MTLLVFPLLHVKYVVTEIQGARNALKCLSLPVELICLSCCHPWGEELFGSDDASSALMGNLWRAKQHLPPKLMLMASCWFVPVVRAARAVCPSGTGARLATAMH